MGANKIKECAIVGIEETENQKMLRMRYPKEKIQRMKIKEAIEKCGGR